MERDGDGGGGGGGGGLMSSFFPGERATYYSDYNSCK